MSEIVLTRLHELMIIIYAISVTFYFIDFIQHNRKVNKMAFWLLSIVWILQSAFLIIKIVQTERLPLFTLYEGLFFYAWVLILFSLVVNRLLRIDFVVFFINVLGFFVMALHTFAPNSSYSSVVAKQLVSELLVFHITMAILAYGAFSLSFIFSLLYLIQYKLLKEKKWGQQLLRIDDLSKLDHFSYILNIIGLPLLLLGVLLGTLWANLKINEFVLYDPKVLGSFFVIIIYSVYFYLRLVKNVQGKTIALWNVACFFIVLINFFLFGSLSRFHLWIA